MRSLPKLNFKIISHLMGLLLLVNGGFMLFPALMSWYYQEAIVLDILLASSIALILGAVVMFFTKNHRKEVQKREGYIIVTLGWIIMSLIGTLPYLLTGAIPNFADAFFETMSGFTTTGATILQDIEAIPKGILFWRSITQWIGGMGIIVLAVAILPLLGIGGMQLFAAEMPGPSGEKLHPRISDTAKRLWLIYVGFTVAETILLTVAGMSFYDAINHSLTTISTGGFSTKNDSMAFWNDNPLIQYIVIAFMFLSGMNFVLSYFAFKRRFRRVLNDEEFRWYALIVGVITTIAVLIIYFEPSLRAANIGTGVDFSAMEGVVRHVLFQVISIITTTGYISADYTVWTPFLTILFFSLMFVGASGGSTSGGIKVMHHLIMIKNSILDFKRSLHPHAILPVRYNDKAIAKPIVSNILSFFVLYMVLFIVGSLVFSWCGLDFISAVGASASTLGNVGPAFGEVGPVDNYYNLSCVAKVWASFLMLVGRLELFTVLILLTPFFWRNR